MATSRSAEKRVRQAERRRMSNKSVVSRIRTISLNLNAAIAEGKKEDAQKIYRLYCSKLDKAVKAKVLRANNASRHKSRIARKLAAP